MIIFIRGCNAVYFYHIVCGRIISSMYYISVLQFGVGAFL